MDLVKSHCILHVSLICAFTSHLILSHLVRLSSSQVPAALGGTCQCEGPGGCFASNKGPWNDPEVLKVRSKPKPHFTLNPE